MAEEECQGAAGIAAEGNVGAEKAWSGLAGNGRYRQKRNGLERPATERSGSEWIIFLQHTEEIIMATKKTVESEVLIFEVEQGEMDFHILGTTPLILRRMSQKGLQELLLPKGKKTAAEKASQLKHDPIAEYRESPYIVDDGDAMLGLMVTSFKNSMKSAALDMPGAKKAQIGRLVYVDGMLNPIYGIPKIFMSVTRSADMNKTPDVRTRMILPEWACRLTIRFTKPILREQSIANLLAAAGFQSGVGDWRQEKGSGNYGCFKLVSADDPDWNRIINEQGRAAQQDAINNPEAYDRETEELLSWFDIEVKRRGFKVAA